MRSLGRLTLGLALSLCAWASVAIAQDVLPPKITSMPTLEVPEGVEVPDGGTVRTVVQVEPDGTAWVERCDATRALCDVVERAIAGSEFAPAMKGDAPVASRVQIDVRLRASSVSEDPEPIVEEEVEGDTAEELVFSETAEVEARNLNFVDLDLEGIRNIPGTLGDPYRSLLLMPCVVPVANGQPYGYVCGAPPAGTAYLYDNTRIPLLFHSAIGAATIHPAIVKDVKLFTSAAPARYGRFTGGVLAGAPREIPNDRVHGEAELRAIDVSGMLNVPLPKDGSMTFSGRYGFPNLLLGALNVDATVDYWDYQYSTDVPMSDRSRFQVLAFGSRDNSVFDESDPTQRLSLSLEYHRFEARFLGQVEDWEVVGTLMYGYDFSAVQDGSVENLSPIRARVHRFGPRFWATYAKPAFQLRLGGDVSGLFGPIECQSDPTSDIPTPCDPSFAAEDRRVIGGVYADANYGPTKWVDVSFGLRTDVWGTSGQRDTGVSPRARATFHAGQYVDVFAGWGFGFMPATYSIPLPALGDVPLEPGLQRANQVEAGVRLFLPKDVTFEARGYVNLFRDIRFVDVFTNPEINFFGGIPVGYIGDSANGESYGATLLLQRPFQVGFSTLASYSLGFSDLTVTAFDFGDNPIQTLDFTPSYDVRHVINGVLQWQSKFGLIVAARLSTRSGRTEGFVFINDEGIPEQYIQRVPWFTRLDATVAYEWARPGRRMRIALEWVNITQARDAQELSTESDDPGCVLRDRVPSGPCPIIFTTAIWFPNLAFRAQF
ncbi:MAG: TonB-dependent receptor [Myxococcota bacterium]